MNKRRYKFIIEESSSSMGQNIYKWLLNKSDLVKEGHQIDSTFGHEWEYTFLMNGEELTFIDAMNTERSIVIIEVDKDSKIDLSELLSGYYGCFLH